MDNSEIEKKKLREELGSLSKAEEQLSITYQQNGFDDLETLRYLVAQRKEFNKSTELEDMSDSKLKQTFFKEVLGWKAYFINRPGSDLDEPGVEVKELRDDNLTSKEKHDTGFVGDIRFMYAQLTLPRNKLIEHIKLARTLTK